MNNNEHHQPLSQQAVEIQVDHGVGKRQAKPLKSAQDAASTGSCSESSTLCFDYSTSSVDMQDDGYIEEEIIEEVVVEEEEGHFDDNDEFVEEVIDTIDSVCKGSTFDMERPQTPSHQKQLVSIAVTPPAHRSTMGPPQGAPSPIQLSPRTKPVRLARTPPAKVRLPSHIPRPKPEPLQGDTTPAAAENHISRPVLGLSPPQGAATPVQLSRRRISAPQETVRARHTTPQASDVASPVTTSRRVSAPPERGPTANVPIHAMPSPIQRMRRDLSRDGNQDNFQLPRRTHSAMAPPLDEPAITSVRRSLSGPLPELQVPISAPDEKRPVASAAPKRKTERRRRDGNEAPVRRTRSYDGPRKENPIELPIPATFEEEDAEGVRTEQDEMTGKKPRRPSFLAFEDEAPPDDEDNDAQSFANIDDAHTAFSLDLENTESSIGMTDTDLTNGAKDSEHNPCIEVLEETSESNESLNAALETTDPKDPEREDLACLEKESRGNNSEPVTGVTLVSNTEEQGMKEDALDCDADGTDIEKALHAGSNEQSTPEEALKDDKLYLTRPAKIFVIMGYLCLFFLSVFLPAWLLSRGKSRNHQADVLQSTMSPIDEENNIHFTRTPVSDGSSQQPLTLFPTTVPTSSPTEPALEWFHSHGPFTGQSGTGFGISVSVGVGTLVVGAPASGVGQVRSFIMNEDDEMAFHSKIKGEQDGSGFGWSVNLRDTVVAVGAPYLSAIGTSKEAGGAYVYEFSNQLKEWVKLGSTIRGDEDDFAFEGDMGATVVVSRQQHATRVCVGAPKSSLGNAEAGRVYTFERANTDDAEWVSLDSNAMIGDHAGDRFGSSLDMSNDGTTYVAGAPGTDASDNPGYTLVYQYVGESWDLLFVQAGIEANEKFGASVAMLSNNGDTFAVGAPDFNEGSGRVQVFQKDSNGFYTQVGSDILGLAGERLGAAKSLGGKSSRDALSVVVGTAYGAVKRFDFYPAGKWEQVYQPLETHFDYGISSLSTSGNRLAVGGALSNEATIFKTTESNDEGILEGAATKTDPPSNPAELPEDTATTEPPARVRTTPPRPPPKIPDLFPNPTKPPTKSPVSQSTLAPTLLRLTLEPSSILESTVPPTSVPIPLEPSNATMQTLTPASDLPSGWELAGGPFSLTLPNSAYGESIAITETAMLVGAPNALMGTGAILSYLPNGDGAWFSSQAHYGAQKSSGFGHAVDMDDAAVIVGAPFQANDTTAEDSGAAFVFDYTDGHFVPVGSAMRGGLANGEMFGASVAISKNRIAAVGAPGNSIEEENRGAFYIFEFNETIADWVLQSVATGSAANERLGEAIDIDKNGGNLIAVGAPGATGSVVLFEKVNGSWSKLFSESGDDASGFGTSVKVLSSSRVAVGSPSHMNGRGLIAVYEKIGSTVVRLPDLVGREGDQLGSSNKLAGSADTLIVGTHDGRVQRFDLDLASQSWIEIGKEADTSYGSKLQAIASSPSLDFLAAGGSAQSSVFMSI